MRHMYLVRGVQLSSPFGAHPNCKPPGKTGGAAEQALDRARGVPGPSFDKPLVAPRGHSWPGLPESFAATETCHWGCPTEVPRLGDVS